MNETENAVMEEVVDETEKVTEDSGNAYRKRDYARSNGGSERLTEAFGQI